MSGAVTSGRQTPVDDEATVLLPAVSDCELAMATADARLLAMLHEGILGRLTRPQLFDVHQLFTARLAEYRAQLRRVDEPRGR